MRTSGPSGRPCAQKGRAAFALAVLIGIAFGVSCVRVEGQVRPPALQGVLADAAHREGIDSRALRVLRMEQRVWPDSGLGCPRPGELHAQVLTPGWLIEVGSGRKVLEYHTDTDDNFVLCAER